MLACPRPARILPLLALLALGQCGEKPRTSILLVTIDTLRADAVGCYGSKWSRTPRIDRFAGEGTRYTDAQSVCPLTLVSHATILTGLLPPQHGLRDNDPLHPLPPADKRSFQTLAESLSAAGYATAAFQSSSVVAARTGLNAGFSVYDGPEAPSYEAQHVYQERIGEETATQAIAWLRSAPKPFFVWVHLFDPHDPYVAPATFRRGGAPGSRQAYAEEVEYADSCLGTILDALTEIGRAEQMLTIVASDHGEGLGDHDEGAHGYSLYQTTLHVPLVVRWPGRIPAGATRSDIVSLAQIAPTILDAADVKGSPGRSLLEPSPPDEVVVSESLFGYRRMNWAQIFAARAGSTKLLRGPEAQVFDLKADPFEEIPRGDAPAPLLAAMERYRALPALAEATGAPLAELAGFPYAAGAGRNRLVLIPWAENARLLWPDPALAFRIDTLDSHAGTATGQRYAGDLEKLENLYPDNPTIPYIRAKLLMAMNEFAAAAAACSRAYEGGLRDNIILRLWLEICIRSNDIDGADRVARDHLAEVSPDLGVFLRLAIVRSRQGRTSEAASLLDEADSFARGDIEQGMVQRARQELGIDKVR